MVVAPHHADDPMRRQTFEGHVLHARRRRFDRELGHERDADVGATMWRSVSMLVAEKFVFSTAPDDLHTSRAWIAQAVPVFQQDLGILELCSRHGLARREGDRARPRRRRARVERHRHHAVVLDGEREDDRVELASAHPRDDGGLRLDQLDLELGELLRMSGRMRGNR